ncbi:MAG TPA: hypothetical protein PKY59_10600 [Pyrinomonadaceae bacterium]|nr:hypothetical protein [Pyrinomonadaceae bacterium]
MPKKQFSYKPNYLYFLLLSLAFSILLIANPISGQSGRRVKNAPPIPVVTETPEPTATPTPKPKPTPQFSLRLVSDSRINSFSAIRMPQDMSKYVAYRLESSPLLQIVSNISGNMKTARQAAINSENDNDYAIFIQLNENTFANPQTAGTEQALRDTYISFMVFAPKTGKTKTSGSAYFKPELLRSTGIFNQRRTCYGTMRDIDYLMLQASYEAAERIMSNFNVPIPQEKCGNQPTFFSSLAGF